MLDKRAVVFFPALQRFDSAPALGGIAHGTDQQIAIDPAFHQVILRAGPDRPYGHGFVIESSEDDDGDLGGVSMGAQQGGEPLFVREGEIQQYYVEMLAAEPLQRLIEPVDMLELQISSAGF